MNSQGETGLHQPFPRRLLPPHPPPGARPTAKRPGGCGHGVQSCYALYKNNKHLSSTRCWCLRNSCTRPARAKQLLDERSTSCDHMSSRLNSLWCVGMCLFFCNTCVRKTPHVAQRDLSAKLQTSPECGAPKVLASSHSSSCSTDSTLGVARAGSIVNEEGLFCREPCTKLACEYA